MRPKHSQMCQESIACHSIYLPRLQSHSTAWQPRAQPVITSNDIHTPYPYHHIQQEELCAAHARFVALLILLYYLALVLLYSYLALVLLFSHY